MLNIHDTGLYLKIKGVKVELIGDCVTLMNGHLFH